MKVKLTLEGKESTVELSAENIAEAAVLQSFHDRAIKITVFPATADTEVGMRLQFANGGK